MSCMMPPQLRFWFERLRFFVLFVPVTLPILTGLRAAKFKVDFLAGEILRFFDARLHAPLILTAFRSMLLKVMIVVVF